MNNQSNVSIIISWLFAISIFAIGVMNVFLVHPVPGIIYLLLSSVYFPPVNAILRIRLGISVPVVVKAIMGIVIIWFTLGVSDLAEMFGL